MYVLYRHIFFSCMFYILFLYSIYSPLHSIHHHLHLRILKYKLKTSLFIYLSITVRQFDVVEESFIITHYNNTCELYNLIIESPVHLSLFLSGISYNSSSLSPSILSTLWDLSCILSFGSSVVTSLLSFGAFTFSFHTLSPLSSLRISPKWLHFVINISQQSILTLNYFVHIHKHAANLFHPSIFCSITPKLSPL